MVRAKVNLDTVVVLLDDIGQQEVAIEWREERPVLTFYLSLTQDGQVDIRCQPTSETGIPEDVYHRRRLWWKLPYGFDVGWLRDWLRNEGKYALQAVLDGWTLKWNGSNTVGVFDPNAVEASEAIEREFYTYSGPVHEMATRDFFPEGVIEDAAKRIMDGETTMDRVLQEFVPGGKGEVCYTHSNGVVHVTADYVQHLIKKELEWLNYNRESEL